MGQVYGMSFKTNRGKYESYADFSREDLIDEIETLRVQTMRSRRKSMNLRSISNHSKVFRHSNACIMVS